MTTHTGKYIITGTSGTGKTALIRELRHRGFAVFYEPQRAVLAEQLEKNGSALPANNPIQFIQALLERCNDNLEASRKLKCPVFFDRGIPDVAAYAIRFGVERLSSQVLGRSHEYSRHAFILAPWKEIFVADPFRQKSFEEYEDFHSVIVRCYEEAGFELVEVPNGAVEERADFVLNAVESFAASALE